MKNLLSFDAVKKFGFEFLSIFVGIFAAFALESWNENRKEKYVEYKILSEINNGLKQDIQDMGQNILGHQQGIVAIDFFLKAIQNKVVRSDSSNVYYFRLFRDFIVIQNSSGYQTLKSKGLEIIENDSLRSQILSLYENDCSAIRKVEEEYSELQLHRNYYAVFNEYLAANFNIDAIGQITSLKSPVALVEKEKNILLLNLRRIRRNRMFILDIYAEVIQKNIVLQRNIEAELSLMANSF